MSEPIETLAFKCPACDGYIPNNENIGAYSGAISRRDNKTEVCSACGTREAMEAVLGLTATNNPADRASTTCKHCAMTIYPLFNVWVDDTSGDGCLQITPFNQVHAPALAGA